MANQLKIRDLSFLLPSAGVFLLLSPLVEIFNSPRSVGGLPLIVLYVFGVWLGLILLGMWLSRHQRERTSLSAELSADLADAAPRRPDGGPGGQDPEKAP